MATTTKREQIEAFLAEPRNIMVGAIRKDGRPQITPNWFLWDGSRFYISTTKTRKKYANFRRDPRVSLVLDESSGFRTVMIDGTVEIWEDHARGLPYFKQLRAKHGASDATDEALLKRLQDEQRVLLAITPLKPLDQWTFWAR